MKLAGLAGREETETLVRCVSALDPEAPSDYRELAALLACDWRARGIAKVGLAGGQGAGKSTLARLIEAACAHLGLRACVIGIDDFYLTKQERRRLAERVHPLFSTRGPPGTHDVGRCRDAMTRLGSPGRVELPVFDKGLDDRAGGRIVEGPFDVVVLEGWCVGAEPCEAAALETPINALERDEDPDGRWRRRVNEELAGEYRELWTDLEALVFLRVPDLAAVRRWRLEQERERPPEHRLDAPAIDRFVQHYERVTLDMLARLSAGADLCVRLAADHSVAAIEGRDVSEGVLGG